MRAGPRRGGECAHFRSLLAGLPARSAPILKRVLRNVDLFLAQTAEDARRLRDIGAPAERVQVSGNLKFDVTTPSLRRLSPACAQLFSKLGPGRWWSAAVRWKGKKDCCCALSRMYWPAIRERS